MSHNAADRKDIRRAEKSAAIAQRQRGEVITSIMSTLAGRSWLWDRLSECHMFSTTYVGGDALATAFQEGRRSVGLSFLADIMAYCPDLYIQAMRESHERHISDNHSASASALTSAGADAERSGSPIGDGGDSGTGPDSSAAGGEDDTASRSVEASRSPGHDVYLPEGPDKQA